MKMKNFDSSKILFFDTETTGLIPGNICQLSYLITDGKKIKPNNYYFTVDYVEPEAERVHGLSVKKLKKLSENRMFRDSLDRIRNDFDSVDMIVAHNFSFDMRFLNAEFKRCGYNYYYHNSFCTMKYFTSICKIPFYSSYGYKWPRLEELSKFFRIREKDILKPTERVFKCKNVNYHDARFDVLATYLCWTRANEMGLLKAKV